MDATKYQQLAARTLVDGPDFELSGQEFMLVWNAIGLAGEAGEVADHIKKGVLHRHGIDHEKIKKEIGDTLWYVAALCTKLGLDLGEVMEANIEKLQRRYPNAGRWPRHVWMGTSVENQEAADERIPHLVEVPSPIRFISCEPLLGPVDLSHWLLCDVCGETGIYYDEFTQQNEYCGCEPALEWVIVGGESGPKARPMHPDWARQLRDQCQAAGVPFFFKQRGEWTWDNPRGPFDLWGYDRLGKGLAGRDLDGRTWDELPSPYHAEATETFKLPSELEEAL